MHKPTRTENPKVAIIGAGMSGLVCAAELSARSISVQVFEKSRGPGGRMSTRRVPALSNAADFDHGAQYFTARAPKFIEQVEQWIAEGVVEAWQGRIVSINADGVQPSRTGTPRFVGRPGMNAVCRRLVEGVDVRFDTRVAELTRSAQQWRLSDPGGLRLGEFDLVVSTAPAPQTAALLKSAAPALATWVARARMQPCWALLAAFDAGLPLEFDGAFVNQGPLSWIARSSSKPGRASAPERWILHANPRWSEKHLEADPNDVVAPLLDAFSTATGNALPNPNWAVAHRWRYALTESPLNDGCLFDSTAGVGACGDWANGNRVEGAFLSGRQMALAIAEAYGLPSSEG
ncbi:MAG: FAD-dependent oxidoreductase [Polyangiales bacterium]